MKNFTSLVFILIFSINLNAQYQICSTTEYHEQLKLQDPQYESRMFQIENDIGNWLQKNQNKLNSTVITIPVVVHVVWNTSAQNIPDARIFEQINVLNNDFARLNADTVNTPVVFAPVAANTQIQFCLAQKDPLGQATNGIQHIYTTNTSFSINNNIKYTSQGGSAAWPSSDYLNIWIGNLSGGLLGYAQFPGGFAATDGVVLNYSSVGGPNVPGTANPYHLGRIATHEVGHWLSLYHLSGDSNCGNDSVADTPIQDMHFGCQTHPFHVNYCGPGTSPDGEMFMNYMDNVDNACMNLFTLGQANRMNAVLNTIRSSLQTSPGCQSVGIEEANNVNYNVITYPNPTTGDINIIFDLKNPSEVKIELLNLLGQTLKTSEVKFPAGKTEFTFSTSEFSKGIYYLKFTSNQNIISKRIIKM